MNDNTAGNIFIQGSIPVDFIAGIIQLHNRSTSTGAHSIFLGQVRSDEIMGTSVKAINYTAHTGIANERFHEIRLSLSGKYPINDIHAYHSVGEVPAGEICLFVLVTSVHRREAINACNEAVERIKAELPIWGKQLYEDGASEWKKNN